MKKIIYFILIGTFSCQMEKRQRWNLLFPARRKKAGRCMKDAFHSMAKTISIIEVSMLAAHKLGEGSYRINEFIEADRNFTAVSTFKGKYSTLYGDGGQEILVQFHNSALENPLKRTYLTRGFEDNLTYTNIKIDPGRSLPNFRSYAKNQRQKHAACPRYDGHPGNSLVTFELFPEGNNTRLKLAHTGLETFPALPDFKKENFAEGWTSIIGTQLRDFVEKRS